MNVVEKIVLNKYMDLEWRENKPVVYVMGKPFRHCSFLMITFPEENPPNARTVDDLARDKRSRSLETVKDIDKYLHDVGNLSPEEHVTEDDIMRWHSMNLIAWIENDYNPDILNTNISFPLLVALSKAGDDKASRVLKSEVHDRVVNGSSSSRMTMIEMGMDEYFDLESWKAVAVDDDIQVRAHAAAYQHLDPAVMETLSKDKNFYVRRIVAGNKSTPSRVLDDLVDDKRWEVRALVATNPNTLPETLDLLAGDFSDTVRTNIARNHLATGSTLARLATDKNINIRLLVAGNPNTSRNSLTDLEKDEAGFIRIQAKETLRRMK
jgi:hypothetical protein